MTSIERTMLTADLIVVAARTRPCIKRRTGGALGRLAHLAVVAP